MHRDLSTWEARRETLVDFQAALVRRFPKEDYNIFVFGSYIRPDFDNENSDIDLVAYCKDDHRQMEVAEFAKAYFDAIGLANDIVCYFYSDSAYILPGAIMNAIRLTSYFPASLRWELYQIIKAKERYLKDKEERIKYERWRYLIRHSKSLIKNREEVV